VKRTRTSHTNEVIHPSTVYFFIVRNAAGVEKVTEIHCGTRTLDTSADMNIQHVCLFSSKETRNPKFRSVKCCRILEKWRDAFP